MPTGAGALTFSTAVNKTSRAVILPTMFIRSFAVPTMEPRRSPSLSASPAVSTGTLDRGLSSLGG